MPESRLRLYSDLFEEVIERDRIFGSLLRKIKSAYDMLLMNPEAPAAWHSGRPGLQPTTRAEENAPWEVQRENQALKDLVERLHLELEDAVRRELRWKQKAEKLKAQREGAVRPLLHQAPPRSSPFQPYRREPGMMEAMEEGPLNQGGLLSLSSISPQHSVPYPNDSHLGGDTARSADSGVLPQRPNRRNVIKPAQIPPLDFSRLNQLEEEEDMVEEDEAAAREEEAEEDICEGLALDELGSEEESEGLDDEPGSQPSNGMHGTRDS